MIAPTSSRSGGKVDLFYEYFHLAGFDLGKVEDVR